MASLEAKLIRRIEAEGPIPFAEFMAMALYDAEHGFYRQDVFGRDGHFYTASQLQPVFGEFVRALVDRYEPGWDTLIDIGAGRGELREAFPDKRYLAADRGVSLPRLGHAVLFANELFDALPVELYDGDTRLCVSHDGRRLVWHPWPPREGVMEKRPAARKELERAYAAIDAGIFLVIDYGYRGKERMRFPQGTLMSYRRHVAREDVLLDPGECDITAHVDWDALISEAEVVGWKQEWMGTVQSALVALGEEAVRGMATKNAAMFKTFMGNFAAGFDVLLLRKGP